GFVPAAGATCTVTLIASNGANPSPAGPFTLTTNASGQVSVTFTSASTGQVTGHASCDVTVAGISLHRETDGQNGNSGNAVKTFVDAKIAISPSATNRVGSPHTFTVTLSKDIGDGNGFVPFSGAHVDFTLTDTLGASSVLNAAASTCDDAGA